MVGNEAVTTAIGLGEDVHEYHSPRGFGCGRADSSAAGAQQITDGSVKIGVMNDMSGLYSDISGRGALVAARRSMLGAGGRLGGNA